MRGGVLCMLAAALQVRAGHASTPGGCGSALDCSLNGECVGGLCHCDPPWSGGVCDVMSFAEVSFPQGYGMQPNVTTWGGGIIAEGDKYHLYVAAMTNDCPLQTWTSNSRVDHAVADSPTGPFTLKDVAIPTWSHNPAPLRLKDGSYAIYHIGSGSGSATGGKNCTPAPASEVAAGSTIHVSASLDGPWRPLSNSLGGCNNPAPWVHSNGTIFIICNGATLLRADNPAGPYSEVTKISHSGGPPGAYEDPYLYTDSRGFHLLYHVYDTKEDPTQCVTSTVSAHAYSVDGRTWRMSPRQPYTTQVAVSWAGTLTVSTRERPKLLIDGEGRKTHLVNGVCSATACPGEAPCVNCKYKHWDYTLVQPFVQTPAPPAPYPPPPPPTGCAAAAGGYQCHPGKCAGDGVSAANCGADIAEPALSCAAGDWACAAAQAAAACNATSGCGGFGLSAAWGLQRAKLFAAGAQLVDNGDWNVWLRA
eukprot:TRINITY_DN15641_c0_g1_i1.p2 TRINITY_DN15641_c0_g1~~TRINITY_DN15641_c0_g1_i1.p2  ORF type:complete len:508 (+),score=161.14 TRINITY_DN15641_c0_g1_i1:98-1525(+)